MKILHMVAFILLAIGGLNWGIVGLGMLTGNDWNFVGMLLGFSQTLLAVVYLLVGLSAIWIFVTHKKDCKMCASGSAV